MRQRISFGKLLIPSPFHALGSFDFELVPIYKMIRLLKLGFLG